MKRWTKIPLEDGLPPSIYAPFDGDDDAWGWWLSRYPQFLATGEDKTPVPIPEPTTDEEAE